ncbi:MAG: hypothetical protein COB40_08205 [Marinosulfonomonas sp.]|nr:MAG: hypothetical protein COB40_08205 [Marinosulfonomonas sp.]
MIEYVECFLRNYQTLVVGLLGFIGVISTLIFNAWMSRNEEKRGRRNKAKSIKMALVSELHLIREAINNANKSLKEKSNDTNDSRLIPNTPLDNLFRALMGELTVLEPNTVSAILNAYLSYETYLHSLTLIATPISNPNYICISESLNAQMISMNEGLIKSLDEELKKLSDGG